MNSPSIEDIHEMAVKAGFEEVWAGEIGFFVIREPEDLMAFALMVLSHRESGKILPPPPPPPPYPKARIVKEDIF